ncbi:type I pullulanase [Halanaerobaculum tunisiense]
MVEDYKQNEIKEAIIINENRIKVICKQPINNRFVIKYGKQQVSVVKLDDSDAPTYHLFTEQDLDYNKSYIVKVGELEIKTILSPQLIESNLTYRGELGAIYTPQATKFRLWAPSATQVELELFMAGFTDTPEEVIPLTKQENGVWEVVVEEDLAGKFYTYRVTNGKQSQRVLDPYAKSMAGFNMDRDKLGKGAVVNLNQTDPEGWATDGYIALDKPQDAIIYEMSVRDFTIAESSGVASEKRGTYLGFIDKIAHLKELGVTHVQLMPILKFHYGNEYNTEFEAVSDDLEGEYNYNWGYDPHNYFTPEGWYSLQPSQPHIRIKEVKKLIQALHEAGIGVILDVVYNHTADTATFEDIVPYYYYRRHDDGSLTNGSGCGNDTASKREMMRKLIIDSTTYWTEEYHVDGFRFDLMGLHDETTVTKVAQEVRKINPAAMIYGEGWNLGTLSPEQKYVKADGEKRSLLKFSSAPGVFNDTIRDGIKHSHFGSSLEEGGFIQQEVDNQKLIRAGIIAGIVEYETDVPIATDPYHRFTDQPEEVVNYVTCHDGYTLWDKIIGSTTEVTLEERKRMHKLATAIILTSQGVPFLHGGTELLRSKPNPERDKGFDHNSYNSSDYTNQLQWSRKEQHQDIFNYYQGLIKLRQIYSAFRLSTQKEIQTKLSFLAPEVDYVVGFKLVDKGQELIVIYNANRQAQRIAVAGLNKEGQVIVDDQQAGVTPLTDTKVTIDQDQMEVPAISPVVVVN